MIIDYHAHLWGKGFIPPAFYHEAAKEWAQKAPDRTPEMIMPKLLEGNTDSDGRLFIENMDQAGVDVTVINMTDFGVHWCGAEPEVPVEAQLEIYGELTAKYKDRLYFFAFFDPRRENCLPLMEKAVKEYGCVGCGEISPENFYVTEDFVQPLFAKCQELGLPVFIHTRAGLGMKITGDDYTRKNSAHPFYIKTLQAKYPDLTIILGHAGFDLWWAESARIARGHSNCYLELSDWTFAMQKPGELVAIIASMRDMVGADHIIFGSDQPSGSRFCGQRSFLPAWTAFMKNLVAEGEKYGYQFTADEVGLIMSGNAKRLMGI